MLIYLNGETMNMMNSQQMGCMVVISENEITSKKWCSKKTTGQKN